MDNDLAWSAKVKPDTYGFHGGIVAQPISIEELEAIINRIRILAPPVNGVLSPELRILAEIYSNMITDPTQLIDLNQLDEKIRPVAITLLGVPLDARPHDGRQHRLPF